MRSSSTRAWLGLRVNLMLTSHSLLTTLVIQCTDEAFIDAGERATRIYM